MDATVSFKNTLYTDNNTIETYIPWVRRIVAKYKGRLPVNVEWDDLIQAGMIGLLEAWQNFDNSKGVSFETFAYNRINGSILDWLRQQDYLPKDVRAKIKTIERETRNFINTEGRYPSESEIAARTNMTLPEYQKLTDDSYAATVIDTISDTDDALIPEGIEQNHPGLEIETIEQRRKLIAAIDMLTEREAQIVQLYYVEDLNLKEIGLILDITEARASQILKKALQSMRAFMI